MYKLVIFDMDGILLDSERLKGLSYAKAINFLSMGGYEVKDIYEQFSNVVGSSREVVVNYMLSKFPLDSQKIETVFASDKGEYSGSVNQLLSDTRMDIYQEMLRNSQIISEAKHKEIIELLHWLKKQGVKIGIATMSGREEAKELLSSLGVVEEIDVILTRDSVSQPKPNPEIYLKFVEQFDVKDVLVIEDSLIGISAAKAAKLDVVVLLTDITKDMVINSKIVRDKLLFHKQGDLVDYVKHCITN